MPHKSRILRQGEDKLEDFTARKPNKFTAYSPITDCIKSLNSLRYECAWGISRFLSGRELGAPASAMCSRFQDFSRLKVEMAASWRPCFHSESRLSTRWNDVLFLVGLNEAVAEFLFTKISIVTPVFKSGDWLEVINCRFISLDNSYFAKFMKRRSVVQTSDIIILSFKEKKSLKIM